MKMLPISIAKTSANSKTRANNPEYLKVLIFEKEKGILKLIELLPLIRMNSPIDRELRIVYLKIFPVLFSHAEMNKKYIEECVVLLGLIKRHPMFSQEKSMFDGWQFRLRRLLPGYEASNKDVKSIENQFVNIPGTDIYDMIGYAELDLFFRYHKWLKHHKLHKYLYFFANLSYMEIQRIDDKNIQYFEEKVDLHTMTTGARNAIVKKLAELNQRSSRLQVFCKANYFISVSIDEITKVKVSKIEVSKVERCLNEMKLILKTPIKKNNMFSESDLPGLVRKSIETVILAALRLPVEELMKVYEPALSLLKLAWGCSFFESEVKQELNVLQSNLNSKWKSCYVKKVRIAEKMNYNRFYKRDQDIYALYFDIENGIRAITWYLENVILLEDF